MAAGNKSSHANVPQNRRYKFNPKRGPKPQVLAEANRTVIWIASLVLVAFLMVIAIQIVW
ncbi:hypothetical protein FZ934_24395 (plasmid) [Rhizobium grahamii]|uniref:Uncharacterized protein n=1 Tax=Rhizobium grahamii TaxID=1120045 RepID=A0A5Q0CH44_9HYPH|nr:hypothetical protein FZ934_24395 [Rhizobium grahamii]QRM51826.1 hypothetical protein F3Y33_21250 [Rhizobium sp. BG6]